MITFYAVSDDAKKFCKVLMTGILFKKENPAFTQLRQLDPSNRLRLVYDVSPLIADGYTEITNE